MPAHLASASKYLQSIHLESLEFPSLRFLFATFNIMLIAVLVHFYNLGLQSSPMTQLQT
jgi:H+/gluconate symporter-like permease